VRPGIGRWQSITLSCELGHAGPRSGFAENHHHRARFAPRIAELPPREAGPEGGTRPDGKEAGYGLIRTRAFSIDDAVRKDTTDALVACTRCAIAGIKVRRTILGPGATFWNGLDEITRFSSTNWNARPVGHPNWPLGIGSVRKRWN